MVRDKYFNTERSIISQNHNENILIIQQSKSIYLALGVCVGGGGGVERLLLNN